MFPCQWVGAAEDAPGLQDTLLGLLPQHALASPLFLQLHLYDALLVSSQHQDDQPAVTGPDWLTCWSLPQWWGWVGWCTESHRYSRRRPPACRGPWWGRCRRSRCWSWWWWPSTRSGGECRTSSQARPSPERRPVQPLSTCTSTPSSSAAAVL